MHKGLNAVWYSLYFLALKIVSIVLWHHLLAKEWM